jgi:hypothetical protein
MWVPANPVEVPSPPRQQHPGIFQPSPHPTVTTLPTNAQSALTQHPLLVWLPPPPHPPTHTYSQAICMWVPANPIKVPSPPRRQHFINLHPPPSTPPPVVLSALTQHLPPPSLAPPPSECTGNMWFPANPVKVSGPPHQQQLEAAGWRGGHSTGV